MANIRIVFPNDIDDASLSCSPAEVASLPVSNLQVQTRGDVWRSDGEVSSQHILGDLNGFKPISCFALIRHNLTASATYRLKLYDGSGQSGTMVYDSGAVSLDSTILGYGVYRYGIDPYGAAVLEDWPVPYFDLWFDAVVAISFDLELIDTANPDGYLQAARMVLGDTFEPFRNMDFGLSFSWREQSKQMRTEGGTLRTDAREAFRRLRISLSRLTPAERVLVTDKMRRIGLRNDFFISCFPESADSTLERDYAGMFKLVEIPEIVHPMYDVFNTTLTIEEA